MTKTPLYTLEEFMDRYEELCTIRDTYKKAFEQTHQEYYDFYGRWRYSNYASFRSVRKTYLKKSRNN